MNFYVFFAWYLAACLLSSLHLAASLLAYIYLYLTASAMCGTGQTIQYFLYLDLFSALYMASSVLSFLSSAPPPPRTWQPSSSFLCNQLCLSSVLPALLLYLPASVYFIPGSSCHVLIVPDSPVQFSLFVAVFVSAM